MVRHRTHSIEFKRQVVQDYVAGETLHGLANRRTCPTLLRPSREVSVRNRSTTCRQIADGRQRLAAGRRGWWASSCTDITGCWTSAAVERCFDRRRPVSRPGLAHDPLVDD